MSRLHPNGIRSRRPRRHGSSDTGNAERARHATSASAGTAVPLVGSLTPRERAKAMGAQVTVDLSKLLVKR